MFRAPAGRALHALATVLVLLGCDEQTPTPVDPSAELPSASGAAGASIRSLDEEFAAIADRATGFAGMYFDAAGTLVVRGVGGVSVGAVRAAVDAEGGSRLPTRARDALAGGTVRVETAMYDFRKLLGWKQMIYRSGLLHDVVLVDVDEVQNKLHIGTGSGAARDRLADTLVALGIPEDALMLTAGHHFQVQTDLADRMRPIPGGVKVVVWRATFGPAPCTITANLRVSDEDYFMTAAHCTQATGELDQDPAYQTNTRTQDDLIGWEVIDPELIAPGTGMCPTSKSGRIGGDRDTTFSVEGCRYSDAALFVYRWTDSIAHFGTIARTTGYGSTTIATGTPRFTIDEESLTYPLVGTTVHKMGYASGWTADTVVYGQSVGNSCVDVFNDPGPPPYYPYPIVGRLCQAGSAYDSEGGDSGSPVFTWNGSGSAVTLVGLHVGLDSLGVPIFSPWVYVNLEVGAEAGDWEIRYD